MKILIVEDEAHIADGLRFNIEAEGHEAEIAADGESGLAMAGAGGFDAIVLDVMMPGMSGFEVARTIRERHDYTPILMLTARSRPEDVLKGFEAGTDDFLTKPINKTELLLRVRSILKSRQNKRELDRALAYIEAVNRA